MAFSQKQFNACVRTRTHSAVCPPGALLESLAAQPDPVMLDSSALHATYGRYTLLACRPLDVLTLRESVLTGRDGVVLAESDAAIWGVLSNAASAVTLAGPTDAPYVPGWIGYIGYEVGRHIETLPGRALRDTALPDLRLAFYDALAVYDAVEKRWSLVTLEFDTSPPGAGEGASALEAMLALAVSSDAPPEPVEASDAAGRQQPATTSNFTPPGYRQAVARCVDYIAAGDIFQVNLSQRMTLRNAPSPPAIYRALRHRNPAWYAAYMTFESAGRPCAVLSASPELFLRVRGRHVLTRPIKGTRGRCGDPAADKAAADELLASEKDNAELAMIVDLLRNDLGRVCDFHTVRVTQRRVLETHPTVFHLVSSVEGRLSEDIGPIELLRAMFPGGSITGAPKIRAMEIIDELENVARGVYTGCVGIIGVDGSAEWNIAIRTVICDGDVTHVQVGGGIVADSDPQSEYEETLHKARGLLEGIAQAGRMLADGRLQG